MTWSDVHDILDGLEELLDNIEEYETWEEFARRIDDARAGRIGDPVELIRILTDMLEHLKGKVPAGPLKELMDRLMEVAIGALEAGASLTRWILLYRYRQARASKMSPQEAAEFVTNDKAAQLWLRLQEQQKAEDGSEDPEVEDPGGEIADPGISTPARPPGNPWPDAHDACCSQGDNGTTPPVINAATTGSAPTPDGTADEWDVDISFDFTHPCGISHHSVDIFTRSHRTPGAPLPPPWMQVQVGGQGETQARVSSSSAGNGRSGTGFVRSAGEAVFRIRAVSNCGTAATKEHTVTS